MFKQIQKELQAVGTAEKAACSQRFFKTGKGQYGEGDIFLGVTVPEQRKIAKNYVNIPLHDLEILLDSKTHEHRLTAIIILINKFQKAKEKEKKMFFDFYIKERKGINNWDLVDISAPNIVGSYLLDKDKNILYEFAKYGNLWEKRIAIVSTLHFIRENKFEDTVKISEMLLNEEHDLLHKAVGWMLRELGKKDQKREEDFLKKYLPLMPRTMLRYAIERFPEKKRKFYMQKTFKA